MTVRGMSGTLHLVTASLSPSLLNQLANEGHEFDEETIAAISPYIREHINRFGDYFLNLEHEHPLPTFEFTAKKKKFARAS